MEGMYKTGIENDEFGRNTFCSLIAEKIRGVDEISKINFITGVNSFNKWY